MNEKLEAELELRAKEAIESQIYKLVHDMNRYSCKPEVLIIMMKELKQLRELNLFVENYNYEYGDGFQ